MKVTATDELNDSLIKLKGNLIFRLSLASKELFHSSFWSCLIDIYPQNVEIFNIKYNPISKIKTLREFEHIDLIILVDNNVYIIENKFKSLPQKKQLIKYRDKEEKIKKQLKEKYNIEGELKFHYKLVSLFKPSYFKNNNGIEEWEIIDYKKLQYLFTALNLPDSLKYNQYIFDYKEFLEHFNKILDYIDANEYYDFDFLEQERIKNLKLDGILKKYFKNRINNNEHNEVSNIDGE